MFHDQQPSRPGDEEHLPDELAALERRLASLTPPAPRVDRDRLMFEAGRASAEATRLGLTYIAGPSRSGDSYVAGPSRSGDSRAGRLWSHRFWPAAAATMTAASIALAVLLIRQTSSPFSDEQRSPDFIVENTATATADMQLAQIAESNGYWPTIVPAWIFPTQPVSGYLANRHSILTLGAVAMESDRHQLSAGDSPIGPSRPPTARELLDEFLPPSARDGDGQILTP